MMRQLKYTKVRMLNHCHFLLGNGQAVLLGPVQKKIMGLLAQACKKQMAVVPGMAWTIASKCLQISGAALNRVVSHLDELSAKATKAMRLLLDTTRSVASFTDDLVSMLLSRLHLRSQLCLSQCTSYYIASAALMATVFLVPVRMLCFDMHIAKHGAYHALSCLLLCCCLTMAWTVAKAWSMLFCPEPLLLLHKGTDCCKRMCAPVPCSALASQWQTLLQWHGACIAVLKLCSCLTMIPTPAGSAAWSWRWHLWADCKGQAGKLHVP